MKVNSILLLFVSAAGCSAPIGLAQAPETFSPTGNLTRPRQAHTATLLTNGKVLIAGGFAVATGWPVWASAELYDPSTRTFTATSDMTTPRHNHTATLLPGGKVLITGGTPNSPGQPTWLTARLRSAELYDPETATFTAVSDMSTARVGHIATLLNNGKVLIAGGGLAQSGRVSAELYDPTTGTFSDTGEMTEAGAETATLLPDGRVLVTKGEFLGPNHAELYDPATGTFTRTGDLTAVGFYPTAVLPPRGTYSLPAGAWET